MAREKRNGQEPPQVRVETALRELSAELARQQPAPMPAPPRAAEQDAERIDARDAQAHQRFVRAQQRRLGLIQQRVLLNAEIARLEGAERFWQEVMSERYGLGPDDQIEDDGRIVRGASIERSIPPGAITEHG